MLITAIMTFSKLLFVTIFASITYIIQLGRKNSKFLGVKNFIFYETSTPRLLYEQTELFIIPFYLPHNNKSVQR